MKEFWNERYGQAEYIYGEAPNQFFKSEIDKLTPGKLLMPADGEGRNGVYAATQGWDVACFDQSEEGQKKANKLAAKHGVTINYIVASFGQLPYHPGQFDAIGLIFAHFPMPERRDFYRELMGYLKPGGVIILESFSKNHLKHSDVNPKAGGPRDPNMLFSIAEAAAEFAPLETLFLEEMEVELREGDHHVGLSSVVRYVGGLTA
jgi:2-polyprenyl-3-methyl-5-hydroxy-6-metoxy-1,4-benzoquinol methylase